MKTFDMTIWSSKFFSYFNVYSFLTINNEKAIAAHEEGEKMVIDEEIMLLQSLVAKLSAYLRSGLTSQLPSDLLRELGDKQKALVSKALMS